MIKGCLSNNDVTSLNICEYGLYSRWRLIGGKPAKQRDGTTINLVIYTRNNNIHYNITCLLGCGIFQYIETTEDIDSIIIRSISYSDFCLLLFILIFYTSMRDINDINVFINHNKTNICISDILTKLSSLSNDILLTTSWHRIINTMLNCCSRMQHNTIILLSTQQVEDINNTELDILYSTSHTTVLDQLIGYKSRTKQSNWVVSLGSDNSNLSKEVVRIVGISLCGGDILNSYTENIGSKWRLSCIDSPIPAQVYFM